MQIKDEFDVRDLGIARAIAGAYPFATIVSANPLRATHMPCLVEEDADELVILGHVARPDPACAGLAGPVLLIFHGVHGYVSASWLLERTVDHFEAAVDEPWSLDRMDGDTVREMADDVVAFRLRAESWHAELKLSQDKPAEERQRVIAGLESPGPYTHRALAQAMRDFAAP